MKTNDINSNENYRIVFSSTQPAVKRNLIHIEKETTKQLLNKWKKV